MIGQQNSDRTHEKISRIDDIPQGNISVLSGAIVKFDYSSKRALKDSQRVPRPPRVEWFSNGMVLIERDNETPEFISGELFVAQYGKAGVN
jgi:hypothetical protein